MPAGGTAGQALTKIDATNYNTTWSTISAGAALPADTVVVAGTRIISNKLLVGDAQPAWRVLGSGRMEFGPGGATAPDTTLYRSSADRLKTDDSFLVSRPGASDLAYMATRDLDGATRFVVDASGKHQWGDGTSSVDTNLYRYGVGQLATDSIFRGFSDLAARQNGAAQVLIGSVNGNAGFAFGSALDTTLYRAAANTLQTDGEFWVIAGGPTAGDSGIRCAFNAIGQRYFKAGAPDSGSPGYRMLMIPN